MTDEAKESTSHRRITEETEIVATRSLDVDEMFLKAMEETDLLSFEFDDDDDIERIEIDPRILRSAMFLYSSNERTRHDWR